MTNVLNNRLAWDGSHLGSHNGTRITCRWEQQGTKYTGIYLEEGWSEGMPGGSIYCIAICSKDLFPCIVDDIKRLFDIPRRGVHRIGIAGKEYILYYVPISVRGEIIWETPLSRLDSRHRLRSDPIFRRDVQKVIAFCDILALCGTGEPSIRIRPGADGKFTPISVNERTTAIMKESSYDYSILSKTLFSKWFGENTSLCDVVKDMVKYQSVRYQTGIPIPRSPGGNSDNLAVISACMRNEIDAIIKRYDGNYIWYSYFIVDRMSRYLLVDS